ncbi:hypothetical protein MNV49_000120 [Pseudohyphozyma bogoriensis]|nr:hypothetical protein MNV49_000120 [Pseudohyphozyma bogoriensis]
MDFSPENLARENAALTLLSRDIRHLEYLQYGLGILTITSSYLLRKKAGQPLWVVAGVVVLGLGGVGKLFVKQMGLIGIVERIEVGREVRRQLGDARIEEVVDEESPLVGKP